MRTTLGTGLVALAAFVGGMAPAPAAEPGTLEDIYGESGNSFQGALGFWVQEGIEGNSAVPGYGVGLDDMVIEWREVSREKDATACATGGCATLGLSVTNLYETSGVLVVTVLDPTPWDPVNPKNDCNGDGDYLDPGDDQDCDNDGTQDVTVRGFSEEEPLGEVFALARVAPGAARWRSEIPYSTVLDVPGTIYLRPVDSDPATGQIRVRYDDRNDGTGQKCANDPDPARWGIVEDATQVFLDPAADIRVQRVRLTDNGDNDGFADPNETVSVFVTLRNRSGRHRDGIVVRLGSNDPEVDCTLSPVLYFGSLADGETRESTTPVIFRVANVTRTDPFAELSATLSLGITGDEFDATTHPQTIELDLDLDVAGGFLPSTFSEGFESAAFGEFTTMTLDVGRASNTLSNGLRCQYNDPNFQPGSGSGNTFCYVGFPNAADNAFDWHVHTTAAPDGGRAYLGDNSLHWGVHNGPPSADTTRLKQLDALQTLDPIFLGWNGVTSELSFKQQVGLTGCDHVNCTPPASADRGIVQIQLATTANVAAGAWRKIYPYENVYDALAVDNYTNCTFDPTDDGNDEDDYFDDTDPNRRHGPSSTCAPEFNFSRLGAIFWSDTFDPADIHHASDGPGLQGSLGPGTWVQSRFDLSRWRGRRLRLRFLVTSIEVATAITMQQALGWNPIEADDGWYVDDIQVSNTLVSAATVTVDTANRSGLPACGPACTSVSASLTATPPSSGAPGRLVELSAASSFADRCSDGILQFRFWHDVNDNGVPGDTGDALLRTWTDNPLVGAAPDTTARYGVEVRCSTLPSCLGSATVLVPVTCPSTGNAIADFAQAVGFQSKTELSWPMVAQVDVIRGDLGMLRTGAGFGGTVEVCLGNDLSASFVSDASTPSAGQGRYYLVRGAGPSPYCNATQSWGTSARDEGIALDPEACP